MTQRTSRKICSSFLNAGYRYLPSEKSRPNGDLFSFRTALFVILWSNRGIRFCNTDHIRRSQRALACPAVCRNGCSRCTSGYPVLSRCIFGREGRVSKDCRPKAIISKSPLLDGRIAQSKQTAFFRRPRRKRTALFPEETIRRRSRWFPPQACRRSLAAVICWETIPGQLWSGHQLPSEACVAEGLNKETGTRFQAFAQTNRLFRIDNEAVRSCASLSARHFIIYADFSANQKLFIRYGTAYFFRRVRTRTGAVFKRTAIFPAAVVKTGAEAEIAVAEFEINPIDADLCQKVGWPRHKMRWFVQYNPASISVPPKPAEV